MTNVWNWDNQLILGGPELSTNSAFGGSVASFADQFLGGLPPDYDTTTQKYPPPISAVIHSRRLKIELGVKNVIPSNN